MGQENKTEDAFLDIFELDHKKYSDDTEIVKEGENNVVNAFSEEKESVAEKEDDDDSLEGNGSEKQAEIEEEGEEDASESKEHYDDEESRDDFYIPEMLQDLAGDGILDFDEDSEYEPSKEGLKNLIQETVEKRSQEAIEDFKDSLPETAGQLLEILENGGTFEDYQALNTEIDFSKVNISNERNQGYLVEDWMKLQGMEDIEIRDRIEGFKDAGLLEKEAKFAQKKLYEHQVFAKEEKLKAIEENRIVEEDQEYEEAEAFEERVLSLTEIKGFQVSNKKAEKLYKFITEEDKNGVTEFEKIDNEENRLLYAMFAMDGFDKAKLSKQEASKQLIKLKKNLGNYEDRNVSPRGKQNRQSGNTNSPEIPWSF